MGVTVIDAGVLIGVLDAQDAYHPAGTEALRAAKTRADAVVIPTSAYAEVLVGPSRKSARAVDTVREFIARFPIEVVALDRSVAERAALLRARHGGRLKLPDALVVATAIEMEADTVITTDRRWPTRSALGLPGELVKL